MVSAVGSLSLGGQSATVDREPREPADPAGAVRPPDRLAIRSLGRRWCCCA